MTPDWALTLIYWTHMTATVIWIGGLTILLFLVLPLARKSLAPPDQLALLTQLQARFDPISWLCLILLVATGMFQMSASPNYEGFLSISNRWSLAILVKHLVFFGMIAVNAVITWSILPGMQRAALKRQKGLEASEEPGLQQQELRLLRVNFALGILILGLTALARIS
jgi:uncharacterized membrane protein